MLKQNSIQMIILASRSPRRVELLKQVGIDCIAFPTDIDETPQIGELPADYVKRLAAEKALAASKVLKSDYTYLPLLAADTIVAQNGEILGKPANDQEAFKVLKKLSASKHEVHTAIAVSFRKKIKVLLSTTQVEMMSLSDAIIKAYIATGEHRDKSGSYAIQGRAGAWVKHIEGSYSGVMGLPLYETVKLINEMARK
ncbi:MAG: Maf family protein [Methylophilaceae bacterium]